MIIIGLGGNVGSEAEVVARFRAARAAIARQGGVRSAPLYRTAPLGPAQPAFLNTAIALDAPDLAPAALIAILLELETLLGRQRDSEVRWGPRTLDLDVLVWAARRFRIEALEVPHPRLGQRRFALAPLVDLLGEDAVLPGLGPAGPALTAVHAQPIEWVGETW